MSWEMQLNKEDVMSEEVRLNTVTNITHEVRQGAFEAGKVTQRITTKIEVFDMSPASASFQLVELVKGASAPAQAQIDEAKEK
jgi:hypothetical protein